MPLTDKERRWAFNHAKEHALEALYNTISDEAHSFTTQDKPCPHGPCEKCKQTGVIKVDRPDIHQVTLRELLRIASTVRKIKYQPPTPRKKK